MVSILPATWVIPPPKANLVAGIGDLVASNDSGAELVTYSLGSCIGVTLYDPGRRVGGLFHAMLPDSGLNPAKAQASPCMFVDTGFAQLWRSVRNLGARPDQLIIKVAGAAQFLADQNLFNIGERNLRALEQVLAEHQLPLAALAVGGNSSRTIRLSLATGRLAIQSPGVPVSYL